MFGWSAAICRISSSMPPSSLHERQTSKPAAAWRAISLLTVTPERVRLSLIESTSVASLRRSAAVATTSIRLPPEPGRTAATSKPCSTSFCTWPASTSAWYICSLFFASA